MGNEVDRLCAVGLTCRFDICDLLAWRNGVGCIREADAVEVVLFGVGLSLSEMVWAVVEKGCGGEGEEKGGSGGEEEGAEMHFELCCLMRRGRAEESNYRDANRMRG